MTDPLTIAAASLALGIAVLAGVWSLPRSPALDGERWFKVMLANLLLGRLDDEGEAAWIAAVTRFVPYHPAGRDPELKVVDPAAYIPAPPLLDGEAALLDALAREGSVPDRWRRMFDLDDAGLQARLGDPADLGPDYDVAVLGHGCTWERFLTFDGFLETIRARCPWQWVAVVGADSGAPDVVGALDALVGCQVVAWDDRAADERVVDILGVLQRAAPKVSDRVCVVGTGDGMFHVLRALVLDPGLRDRVAAVISIGGRLGGTPEVDAWMAEHFGHRSLDTEIIKYTPYFSVAWLDRAAAVPGVDGLPLGAQRFPEPVDEGGLDTAIARVDLGSLPADPELPVDLVARALATVSACWVLARS